MNKIEFKTPTTFYIVSEKLDPTYIEPNYVIGDGESTCDIHIDVLGDNEANLKTNILREFIGGEIRLIYNDEWDEFIGKVVHEGVKYNYHQLVDFVGDIELFTEYDVSEISENINVSDVRQFLTTDLDESPTSKIVINVNEISKYKIFYQLGDVMTPEELDELEGSMFTNYDCEFDDGLFDIYTLINNEDPSEYIKVIIGEGITTVTGYYGNWIIDEELIMGELPSLKEFIDLVTQNSNQLVIDYHPDIAKEEIVKFAQTHKDKYGYEPTDETYGWLDKLTKSIDDEVSFDYVLLYEKPDYINVEDSPIGRDIDMELIIVYQMIEQLSKIYDGK